MKALKAERVSVDYRQQGRPPLTVLSDISITIAAGQIVGLAGPSGRGKTTLARAMAGLVPIAGGQVRCDGVNVGNVRRRSGRRVRGKIGMVFQSPRRSCNPLLSLRHTLCGTAQRNIDLERLLASVALAPELLERFPAQVSDGQLQRLALARTLAAAPRYLILDEATAMLDPVTTAIIVGAIRQFAADGGGVLMISHDEELLSAVAGSTVVL
ncbi:Nickel import ATP-binding protein NikE [Carnimonas sp. R-84981]|uniref:ATP-binding cassette domain-containing protein n=1 Tax=Carnimonas bestiolae TaxID=3402172 RepID=UPI003EDBD5E8